MNNERRRPLRSIAGLVAGALVLTASPLLGAGVAGAADDLPPLADPLGDDGFCEGAPDDSPFSDLGGESTPTRQVILCLVASEITQGATATTYAPGAPVNRRQMALFIKRLADLFDELEQQPLDALPAYDGSSDHSDVSEDDPGAEAIGQLTQAGIVGGFPDGTYRPNELVSRRQMAAFVNRLQDFVSGAPYSTEGDFFDDDEDDSGEANLNALASVGIFQGDGQGNVFPGQALSRRQMANILLRDAQVHYDFGSITTPFGVPNETLSFGPDAALTLTDAEGDSTIGGPENQVADNAGFTATGLSDAFDYRITLVESDNVTTSGGGRRTFAEDGTSGLAAPGDVGARIVAVNGTSVSPAVQSVGAISPVNGSITVTIDAYRFGTATPVLYVDGGSHTRLELDDSGAPTEAFGVAADVTTLPMEAPAAAFDVEVIATFKATDTFIGQLGDQQNQFTYDANDTFRDGPIIILDGISMEDFESRLSRGDFVSGSYNPAPEVGSTFELEDISPAPPVITSISNVMPTSARVNVDETTLHPDASVQVFLVTPPGAFDPAATPAADTVVDGDPVAAGFQVDLTGLTPGTSYSVYATQTIDGERSNPSPPATLVTPSAPAALAITAAAVNEQNDGVNGDTEDRERVLVTYSGDISCRLVFAPGDATISGAGPDIVATGCEEGPDADQVLFVFAGSALNDANPDVTYTIEVAQGAVSTDPGGSAVQADSQSFGF